MFIFSGNYSFSAFFKHFSSLVYLIFDIDMVSIHIKTFSQVEQTV